MRQTLFLLALLLTLPGCVIQTRNSEINGLATYDGVSAEYPGDAQALATMTAGELARRYPASSTTLILATPKAVFGLALDAALRQKGFSVSQSASTPGITVGYTLDVLRDEATCYLQVRTSDGQAFGQARPLGALNVTDQAPSSSVLESATLHDEFVQPRTETVATKPVPEPTATDRSDAIPVRNKATAAKIAKRNKVSVADFCRWNNVKPQTVLEAGRLVHLRGPAAVSPPAPVKVEPAHPAPAKPTQKERQTKPVQPAPAPSQVPAPVAEAAKPVMHNAGSAKSVAPILPAEAAPPAPAPAPVPVQEPTPAVSAPAVKEALAELSPRVTGVESPPVAQEAPAPSWSITPGSLHTQLESWSYKAQYQLVWKAKHDFELATKADFSGDFVSAIKQLFAGLQRGGHALRVTIYQGNSVIEVAED